MIPDGFARFYDLLPDALLVHAKGQWLYANPAARQLLALGDRELGGLPDLTIDAAQSAVRRLDGTLFEAEIRTSVTTTPAGEEAVLMIVRDVSDGRLADRTRRAESLGRVAYSIAHELNNVLMGAQTFATVLSRKLGNDDTGLQGLRTALDRGKQVTADMLRFARGVEVNRQEVAVEEWLHAFVGATASAVAPATIALRIDDAPTLVRIDRAQLSEALTTIIMRARDAKPDGTIDLTATRSGDELVVRVTDRGEALSAEAQDRLFEPSFSTKKSNALVMAVAQQIVLRHGGRVEVVSDRGFGTTIVVFVPAS